MSEVCAACQEPLLVLIESDSEEEDPKNNADSESVPDDVELKCGCHFHWFVENTFALFKSKTYIGNAF